jgi:outer membrane receptor for monomeric catechols
MTNVPTAQRTALGAASLAAAMLMVGPAFAADADAGAEAEQRETITVTGQKGGVSIPTVRGPLIDVPQTISVVSPETIKEQRIISSSFAGKRRATTSSPTACAISASLPATHSIMSRSRC